MERSCSDFSTIPKLLEIVLIEHIRNIYVIDLELNLEKEISSINRWSYQTHLKFKKVKTRPKDAFPSNWYWTKLLIVSSKKKTKWWFCCWAYKKVDWLNASTKCRILVAVTIVNDFKYGEILTIIVSRQSYNDDIRVWPLVINLWKIMINKSPCDPLNDGTSRAALDCQGALSLKNFFWAYVS